MLQLRVYTTYEVSHKQIGIHAVANHSDFAGRSMRWQEAEDIKAGKRIAAAITGWLGGSALMALQPAGAFIGSNCMHPLAGRALTCPVSSYTVHVLHHMLMLQLFGEVCQKAFCGLKNAKIHHICKFYSVTM